MPINVTVGHLNMSEPLSDTPKTSMLKPGDMARNRIIWGAPGTGKSFLINEESKAFNKLDSNVKTEDEKLREALANCENDGDYTAVGIHFKDILSKKSTPQIKTDYNCSLSGAYCLMKGANAEDVLTEISTVKKNDKETKINNDEAICNLLKEKVKPRKCEFYGLAVGYVFSSLLYGRPKEELLSVFDLAETPIIADWLVTGAKAANYHLPNKTSLANFVERVTFHPNYSFAQFVGTYKPVQDDDPQKIIYSYVPGPFMRTYVRAQRALQNKTDERFLLIIEEINRANVAAVFGDVFQLLDRDSNGVSVYPVAASEDIKRYLSVNGITDCNELKIPSNMYVWATMNSADQGVFPMDTAFKRRWEFEYIGVNDGASKLVDDAGNNIKIPVPHKASESENVIYEDKEWDSLRRKINEKLLKELKVNEDKLMGPFFINLDILKNACKDDESRKNFVKSFKSKVLMYLFEDVAKMNPGKLFSGCGERPIYSEVCEKFDEIGEGIFGFKI